jgi:hypothetical protein
MDMTKQWGHGYHKGVEAANNANKSIVGLWFHSIKDGSIEWQGRIVKSVENDCYIIQLYSWIDGYPTDQKMVLFSDMQNWNFYRTDKDMRRAWHKANNHTQEDWEAQEEFIQLTRKA